MTTPARYTITLEPIGRRVVIDDETNLLEAAQKAGVDLVASCGGVGICGLCRVRVSEGRVTPVTFTEREALGEQWVNAGFRLACQMRPLSDVMLDIPPESLTTTQQMQIEGREAASELLPAVIALDLRLERPALTDLRADLDRVNEALAANGLAPLRAPLALLGRLSTFLRASSWAARLAVRPEAGATRLVGIYPPQTPLLGLAIDIGSTKLALYLVDLNTGGVLRQSGIMNPQIAYGEDVVSRIAFANKSAENRALLQTRLVESLNQGLAELCALEHAAPEQVVDVVAVGNTAIHHLFTGLPVEQLGEAPYVPVVSHPLDIAAAELGLAVAPGARVFLPANIAGYVGADHVSALLATHSYAAAHTSLLVDIGTNTEISLTHHGQVYSCSCASGPAFEGAHIRDGMRAAPGAIEKVRISADSVQPVTIGNQPAVGICGSGILQAVAQMAAAGIIDERGVLNQQDPRVRVVQRKAEFLLVSEGQSGNGRDIVVTRKDVNEIQLAKGAIRAGIDVLLLEAGLTAEDVQEIFIAGAFGAHLDLASAIDIGMFPRLPQERYHQVGNAAGVGAKQMLLSAQRRAEAARIVERVQYIELTTYPQFTPIYVEAMYLKS